MTNPEQTLRERLAEAVGDSVVGYTNTALQHETLTDNATDAALKAIREWLESEAVKVGNECEQDRKSITGGIMASPYLRGKYSAIKTLAQSLGDTP